MSNSKKKGFKYAEDPEIEAATIAMEKDIPKVEKILKKFGKVVRDDSKLFYTGFSWTITTKKAKNQPKITTEVYYSDSRFELVAHRKKGQMTLIRFTGWLKLDKLEKFLDSFFSLF